MTTPTIAVAGAAGNLGGRIVKSLLERKAGVKALVRPGGLWLLGIMIKLARDVLTSHLSS